MATYPAIFGVSVGYTAYKLLQYHSLRKGRAALQNKVVVITGASGGLGEALAHQFYRRGCQLVLCARRKPQLEQVAADLINLNLQPPPPPPIIHTMDVSDLSSIEQHVQTIKSKLKAAQFPHIDILVNNAGILHQGAVIETKIDVQRRVMDVNYLGAVAMTTEVLGGMQERRSGHLVYISSVQGVISLPLRSAYGASKHAISSFSESLRFEVSQFNIAVSVINPGYIKTGISENALTGSGATFNEKDPVIESGYSSEYVAKEIVDAVAVRRKEVIIATAVPTLITVVRRVLPGLYRTIIQFKYNQDGFVK